MRMSRIFVFAVPAGALLLSGCTKPDCVNPANFSQIQQNVHTQADVESILGAPDSKLSDMWVYQRPDDHVTVLIDFDAGGRVTRKQWVDGMTGAWDDTNEKPKPVSQPRP